MELMKVYPLKDKQTLRSNFGIDILTYTWQ